MTVQIDVRFAGATGKRRYTFPHVPPIFGSILIDGAWYTVTHVAYEEIGYYVRQGDSDFEWYIVVEKQKEEFF